MRISLYSADQEEKIYIRREARTWSRSGLITDVQLGIIDSRTETGLTQTNIFFRILFFLFTNACMHAVMGLYVWMVGIRDEVLIAWAALASGIAMVSLAEYLAGRKSFYRHGIEEALALAGMALACTGIVIFVSLLKIDLRWLITTAALLASAGAFWLYLRFGFLYAAVLSAAFACVVPFQLSLPPAGERAILSMVLVLVLLTSIRTESFETRDFRKERSAMLQAFLLAGIYLAVNLRLPELGRAFWGHSGMPYRPFAGFPPLFYWMTYGLTFLIPALGLYHGLKRRKRIVINVSLIAALLTLATNKDYLGFRHYAWDPAILGAALIIAAIAVMRWLANGSREARRGFTAQDLLKPENRAISLADIGAAVLPGAIHASLPQASPDKPFDGGQSGGGGASQEY
ncbi:MAG TPA: hypothetical protein VFG28_12365 [Syntrophales bacterium]|nr:hypothetical protein [Syntrophales bacterium]